jgi:hypothetical protein
MYAIAGKINLSTCASEFCSQSGVEYGKLEERQSQPYFGHPGRLLVRHPLLNSGTPGLLCHVIVVDVEPGMLHRLALDRGL